MIPTKFVTVHWTEVVQYAAHVIEVPIDADEKTIMDIAEDCTDRDLQEYEIHSVRIVEEPNQ